MIELNIHLFGKPDWEINIEEAKAEEFQALGEELKERLLRISHYIKVLEEKGWERSAGLYDIVFFKDITKKQAERELKMLQVNTEDVHLEEWDEREWE